VRIKELIIEEFGKFKNKKLSFDSPFTLIYGPNESGKTTILEAIEYALIPNATLSRDYPVKESKLIIEDNNEVFELKKGKILKGKSSLIEFFISMKPKFFRNIFHIRTGELEILKKIESGMDFASHLKEKILELENFYDFKNTLEDKLGYLVLPSKRKSNIEEEIKNMYSEKEELEKKKKRWERVRNLVIEKEELSKKREALELKLKNMEERLEKMDRARKIEEYKKELKHRHSLKRVYEDLNRYQDFNQEDLSFLEDVERKLLDLKTESKFSKEKKKNLEETLQKIRERIEHLVNEEKKLYSQTKEKLKRKVFVSIFVFVLIIINIIFKIILSLSLLALIPSIILFLVLISLILNIISGNRREFKSQLEDIRKEKENEGNREEKEEQNLHKIEEKIKEIEIRIKDFENKRKNILEKAGVNSIKEYKRIWEKKFGLERDRQNLERYLEGEFILPDENINRIDELGGEIKVLSKGGFEEYNEKEYLRLNEEMRVLREKAKKLNEEIVRMEKEIELLKEELNEGETEIIKKIDELENEINKKLELKKMLIDFYKILKEIEEETELFLKKVIEEEGSKWFSRITRSEYRGIEISKWEDFYIILNNNEKKSITWLSKGAQDQLYFSLRLALAQKILGEEAKFFLILDDPFITFDNYRIREAFKILNEISQEHQIILATKDGYLKELFRETGGNIIELENL
jgi:DNA sulfur modification protein DndD